MISKDVSAINRLKDFACLNSTMLHVQIAFIWNVEGRSASQGPEPSSGAGKRHRGWGQKYTRGICDHLSTFNTCPCNDCCIQCMPISLHDPSGPFLAPGCAEAGQRERPPGPFARTKAATSAAAAHSSTLSDTWTVAPAHKLYHSIRYSRKRNRNRV